jgi:Xaa-Pro dipeptidase
MSSLSQLFDDHIRIQRQRTDDAMATCKVDTLAIHAGSPHMLFLDDHPYPFKPNPHFKLWVPLEDPVDCWLVYRPGEKPRLIFLQPADYWHKPPSLRIRTHHFQIEVIRSPAKRAAISPSWAVARSSANRRSSSRTGASARPIRKSCRTGCTIHAQSKPSTSSSACATLARCCSWKVAAEAVFRAGKSEYEIHMAYARHGTFGAELPYSIVALNKNASTALSAEREAPATLLFLIDAGRGFTYAADQRTYAASDGDFAALIAGMESLQLQLCAQVRSGVDYANIHLDSHQRTSLLYDSGIITMPAGDAVASGLWVFGTASATCLGLQVHDVEGSVDAKGTQKGGPRYPSL